MLYLKFAFIIVLLMTLLHLKIKIGISLILTSFFTIFLFSINYATTLTLLKQTVTSSKTNILILTIFLIYTLTNLMQQSGEIESLTQHLGISKFSLIFPAMLIGLIPMPGGAMVSAPIVGAVAEKIGISKEGKVYFNYWYRHIWEFFWPLYPAIILLMNGILNIPFGKLFIMFFPFTILNFTIGYFLFLRKLDIPFFDKNFNIKNIIKKLFPIFLLIILYISGIKLIFSLLITIAIFVSYKKIDINTLIVAFKKAFSLNMILLIYGVMFFKIIIEKGNLFSNTNIPNTTLLYLFILILPFLLGLLTGLTIAGISIIFPIFIKIIPEFSTIDTIALYNLVLAGVLLSPVHLCLILTTEYFDANLTIIYRKYIIPSVLPLFILTAILEAIKLFL